jgi:hypothetical protein
MSTLHRLFSAGVIAVASTVLLVSQECRAQDTVYATKIFENDAEEEHGIAYDAATDRLYTIQRASTVVAPQLRAYTLDGTLVSGPHLLTGTTGSLTRMGIHFIREATTIGLTAIPAGTLIYLRDGTLYALDKTDGSVIASEVVGPDFDTGGLCKSPLAGGGKGLGYSTSMDRFLTTSSCCNCAGIAVFSNSQTTGFFPLSVPGSGGAGDVKERPITGNLWVGNAPGIFSLSVLSHAGVLLREFLVLDASTLAGVGIMRIAFDTTGDRLWIASATNGQIYQLDMASVPQVPALSLWAWCALVLVLGCSALYLGRRERFRSA